MRHDIIAQTRQILQDKARRIRQTANAHRGQRRRAFGADGAACGHHHQIIDQPCAQQ